MDYHFLNIRAIILTFIIWSLSTVASEYQITNIKKFEINSSINPATLNYLTTGMKNDKNDAYLIQMDTPGGLLSTTKEIIQLLSNSTKPVILWVGPSGSSATSAGAIIAASTHLLYMAEGTNIGAATPITTSGDIKKGSDLRSKAVNDIKALVKAQAQMHERNHKPFEKMIDKADSFTAKDALKLKVINGIANTQKELLKNINGKSIKLNNQIKSLKVSTNYKVNHAKMDIGQKLLNFLSSPNLAYILFMIGAALIYFEFQAPGGFISGAIGSVFILLAGISFQVLPLNVGALGLIILSFILFVMEIYITSFGLLSIAGVASLVTGSMFLFRTTDSYLTVSSEIIFSTVSAIVTFIAIVFYVFLKTRKNIGKLKPNQITLEKGQVIEAIDNGLFMIKSHGEYWKATSDQPLNIGDKVKVLCKNEDLSLKVEKIEENNEK